LYIDVERYSKTKQARAVSARSFVTRTSVGVGAQSSGTLKTDIEMSDAPEMSAVNNTIVYEVDDPASIGGKKQLLREDLAKGYEYGSTVVPMEEANENTTNFESFKSFSIIGFIPSDKVCVLDSEFLLDSHKVLV
jgi:ATP-dependent DNA helicase 2 subunit 2